MKIKLSLIMALLLGIGITYTACKKSSNNPSGPALTPKQVSVQIATNIEESLYGLGGLNLSEGLNAPVADGVIRQGRLRINDIGNPLCGLDTSTTVNETTTDNGMTISIAGVIKFNFSCVNDVFNGYTFYDNLNVKETSPQFDVTLKFGENITLLSLNPLDDNSKISLNGTVNSDGTYNYKTGSKQSGAATYDYAYKSILIDPNDDAGIVSGTATFNTKGSGTTGVWDYQGTITFLGNNKVAITINGASYTVDITTGQTS